MAFGLRLYGLDWDQGQHLHPDERFLTMVAADIKLPSGISQYFSTATSPLNPGNFPQYQFFVYGTLPLFLTKVFAVFLHLDSYSQIHFVGRVLSAVFDAGNIFLLFYLSKKIWPSFLYATCVLPIQLSHFFTVDTFLIFFLLLTFNLLNSRRFVFSGLAFGCALACKISALYFLPIILLYFIYHKKILGTLYFVLFTFISFRFFQPYAFTGLFNPNPLFLENLKSLQSMGSPDGSFPPSVQWLSKIPLLNSFKNIILWGLGLPASLLFLLSVSKIKLRKTPFFVILSLVWILVLYFYQGAQFAHTMRYFLPIYPFIYLVIGQYFNFTRSKLSIILLVGHLLYLIAFISIYSHPHSRVQASGWIYQNIPIASKITNEVWDDPLPLSLPGYDSGQYFGSMLPLYDPDSPQKWQELNSVINSADYLIMSSNRLWGSIPLVPQKYPETSKFYKNLFAGNLSFKKAIEINSYPGYFLPFLKKCFYLGPSSFPGVKNYWLSTDTNCFYPGIYFRDDTAEEAFTVYDHPKVIIYQNVKKL